MDKRIDSGGTSNTPRPMVSVVIPCRNEEKFIGACLDSILANDYPITLLEVLVVDGMSTDGTRRVVEEHVRNHEIVHLVDNLARNIPAAMNVGIGHARGDIILKVDAHSSLPSKYVSICLSYMDSRKADVVGGVFRILPGAETSVGRAIADALSHPFGSGNAYAKIGSRQPRWTDTVAFGCYRRSLFSRIGGYNEELAGSSDLDLNTRLSKAGGRILLVPEIAVEYFADPDLRSFWRHNFADGVWATYVLKFGSPAWRWRHWIPLVFVFTLLFGSVLSIVWSHARWPLAAIASVYGLMNLGATIQLAVRNRRVSNLWAAPVAFANRHLAHGLGALYGLLLVLLPGKRWRGRRTATA